MIQYLRELHFASVVVRLALAMLLGGCIGLERGRKRRPAGFRTYMLVCLGAALTVLLSLYEFTMVTGPWSDICAEIGIKTDVSRFGAQVINGIGFLGAGTILYMEFYSLGDISTIINQLKSQNVQIYDIDIERNKSGEALHPSAIFSIRLNEKIPHTQLLSDLAELDCFCVIEEL